jgi:hypothetical protein
MAEEKKEIRRRLLDRISPVLVATSVRFATVAAIIN